MHKSIFLLFGAALSVLAQKDEQFYCTNAKAFNLNARLDIKYHGVKDTGFYKISEWQSGNCQIDPNPGPIDSDKPSIRGEHLKRFIPNILDTCDTDFKVCWWRSHRC